MNTDKIKVTPQWSKSNEEIWTAKFAGLEDKASVKIPSLRRRRMLRYLAAAVIATAVILPSVAFLYTKEVTAPRGEHLSVVLPDGSTAELNAESRVKFKPLWWKVAREAEMSGEIYFEAQSGRRFTVESDRGKVVVLGTEFNVYDRAGNYNVTCLSGRVEVSSDDEAVILTSGMSAQHKGGRLTAYEVPGAGQSTGWRAGEFRFESVPLSNVIAEVERQYDIKVTVPKNMDYLYSGYFIKTQSPEQVLEVIGKPFGIKFRIE